MGFGQHKHVNIPYQGKCYKGIPLPAFDGYFRFVTNGQAAVSGNAVGEGNEGK